MGSEPTVVAEVNSPEQGHWQISRPGNHQQITITLWPLEIITSDMLSSCTLVLLTQTVNISHQQQYTLTTVNGVKGAEKVNWGAKTVYAWEDKVSVKWRRGTGWIINLKNLFTCWHCCYFNKTNTNQKQKGGGISSLFPQMSRKDCNNCIYIPWLNRGWEITAAFADSPVWSLAATLLFLAELIISREEDGQSGLDQMGAGCRDGRAERREEWPRASVVKVSSVRTSHIYSPPSPSGWEQVREDHFSWWGDRLNCSLCLCVHFPDRR